MSPRSHHPERQRNPELPRKLDVRGETHRRVDDIQYESMRKRFLPRAREQMSERLSRETPVTPWQRGRDYQWIRMQNGMAYAVYDNGTVKVSFSRGNRPPMQIGLSMCPPLVQQKHMEMTVAPRSAGTPRESRETGLRWVTKTQRTTGEQYEYLSLRDGTKYAVFHRGPRIQRFTRREGIVNLSFAAAPAFIQEHAMEFRVARQAPVAPRQPTTPAPEERQRPLTNGPEPSAPPEVAASQTRVPEAPSDISSVQDHMRASEVLESISSRVFTMQNGETVRASLPATFNGSFFARNSIPDVRLGEYMRNMTNAADRLQQYLSSSRAPTTNLGLSFNGMWYELSTPKEKIIATSNYLITEDTEGKAFTQNGERITMAYNKGMTSVHFSDRTEFFSSAGSLRMRKTPERTEYYDGGDGSRPTVVMANQQTELSLDGRAHSLRAGIYHVPERGAPIGRFESGRSFRDAAEKARYNMNDQDRESAQRYLDDVVRTLKTPEAISAFVTSNFDFVSRGGLHGGAIRGEAETQGEQYAQHPLRTIFLGSGDCEDFAILLQYMCARAKQFDPEAGASSFVAKTYETHNAAYYLEQYTLPDGTKAFALCKMHVHGFERQMSGRNGQPFRSHEEALRALWDTRRSPTGVHAEIASIESQIRNGTISRASVESYLSTLRELEREGGGLILMNKDLRDVNDAGVQEGPAPFSADFSAFVRRG